MKSIQTEKLAIPGEQSNLKLPGIEVKEPTFGIDAIWIEAHKQTEAESHGYVVVEPETVLTTHVSHMMTKYAGELLGQDDVQALLDNLSNSPEPGSVCCTKADPAAFSNRHPA